VDRACVVEARPNRWARPAAGRGHIVLELRKRGLEVVAQDLIAHDDPL
jgi:hypothetical protein